MGSARKNESPAHHDSCGKIVYHKAFGMADNSAGRPLKPDDIFRIASQTKAVTATAVMILWEEGRFRLDDPISKFIPEFKNPQILKTYNEQDGTWTGEPARRRSEERRVGKACRSRG